MDDYCKCKDCKYVDPTERDGYKWYCELHKIYVDPDEIQECKSYSDR